MGPPTGRAATVTDDIRPPQAQPVSSEVQPSVRLRNIDTRYNAIQDERAYLTDNQPPLLEHQHTNEIHSNTNLHHVVDSPQSNRTQSSPSIVPGVAASEEIDSPDGPPRHSRVNVTFGVSTEQEVCDSTPDLLTTFIVGRMERDGYSVPPELSLRNRKRESDVAHVLRDIGDDIMKNYQLNHYISEIQVTPHTAYKTFASVASQIFSDGSVNWGRIVMLFYFAYKLALQVLNQLPLIEIIIGWVKQFVTDRLAGWISSRGGWNAIHEYYNSSNTRMLGMFIAGFLAASCLFWYMKKK